MEAFNSGNMDDVVEVATADVEIHSPDEMPNPGTFVGPEGYLTWVSRWMDAWERFTVTPLDMRAVGDRCVVARVEQWGKGRGSGIETTMEVFHFWEIRDGKIARFHISLDEADALAAASAA